MSETCNSRHFSWLMKSCFPSPNDKSLTVTPIPLPTPQPSQVSLFPDDLLLECLSRLPSADIPAVSAVCRRWHALVLSPSFFLLRRHRLLLSRSVFAFSVTDSGVFAATLQLGLHPENPSWEVSLCLSPEAFPPQLNAPRLAAIGPGIYVIAKDSMVRYDAWTRIVISRSPMIFPRKKFASAVVSDKIYVAGGGGSRATAVEEYDPETDTWRIVSHAPRKRYGCTGAAVDGVFYVIGGLKIREASENDISRAAAPDLHQFAGSMDLFDVETGAWLRSRAVPGGGCVVAACATAGHIYVLTSHAVELSFWRFDGRRRRKNGNGNGIGGGATFGEWCRMKSPPMPTQVRLDSTVRFSFVGVGDKVVLIQVVGCIDDLLRRGGRSERGLREGLVLVYETGDGEWSRTADLPEVIRRAACVSVEC